MLEKYFDHIYCINLDHRADRWLETRRELQKHGIEGVERFSATDGSALLLDKPSPLKPGEIGINRTYIRLLDDAIKKNYETILIVEDDVVFADAFGKRFRNFMAQVPCDWDMLYIGGNHLEGDPVTRISDNVGKLNFTYANHCVAIRKSLFRKIADLVELNEKQVDVYMAGLHRKCNAYGFFPALAWQRESFSNIHNRVMNYDYWLKSEAWPTIENSSSLLTATKE